MIGIDIVNIKRFNNKSDSLIKKVFSNREIKEAKSNNFYQKLAGKWAGKEAAFKAGLLYANKDIEILNYDLKPTIYIKGQRKNYLISISHERDYAVAIVHYDKNKKK